MVSSVTNNNTSTSATAATSSSTTNSTGASSTKTSASTMQDQFMKLLVAQLNNQDPMNPMDNAQMTSQIAQINTVSGINQLNDTMKSLSTQFNAMQTMQGTSMIGHDVLLQSNTLSINSGVAKGAVVLPTAAGSVNVQILSPGGQLMDTVNLGPLSAGQHTFQWDASNYTGAGSPTFKVIATNGKQTIDATGLAEDTVTGVDTSGTTMNIEFKGRVSAPYSSIQTIL